MSYLHYNNIIIGVKRPFPRLAFLNHIYHFAGDDVYVWSSGGVEYAKEIAGKLGIENLVKIIAKPDFGGHRPDMDLAFDDVEKNLAKTNILVKKAV